MAFGSAIPNTHPLQASLEAVCQSTARASAPVACLCVDLRRRFIEKTPEFLPRSSHAVPARTPPRHRTQEKCLDLIAPRARLRWWVWSMYVPIIVDLPPSSYHEWHSLVNVHYTPPFHHVGRPLSETCHPREISYDSHIRTFSNADVVPHVMLPFATSTVRFSCAPCASANWPILLFFRLRSLASRTHNSLVRKLGK